MERTLRAAKPLSKTRLGWAGLSSFEVTERIE